MKQRHILRSALPFRPLLTKNDETVSLNIPLNYFRFILYHQSSSIFLFHLTWQAIRLTVDKGVNKSTPLLLTCLNLFVFSLIEITPTYFHVYGALEWSFCELDIYKQRKK